MKRKTNFDQYLEEQLKDEGFAERFKKAGEAWDVALELAALRKESGLSQKELAETSGVALRMIQLYEQKQNDINKAQASSLQSLAQALGCKIEDLFE